MWIRSITSWRRPHNTQSLLFNDPDTWFSVSFNRFPSRFVLKICIYTLNPGHNVSHLVNRIHLIYSVHYFPLTDPTSSIQTECDQFHHLVTIKTTKYFKRYKFFNIPSVPYCNQTRQKQKYHNVNVRKLKIIKKYAIFISFQCTPKYPCTLSSSA